ncbi:MAG: hypothetical protein ISQ56_07575 [Pseudomonadales bacterium]|nr:hypothetical protein [Pseudomonadales bacterium]MBL6805168.1 hypothetical protein [Pseudomonadales bacterium]
MSNYNAGLSIIITRPFVVGDAISVKGEWSIVEEVHLLIPSSSTKIVRLSPSPTNLLLVSSFTILRRYRA